MSGPEELRALVEEMRAALAFYADPDSYRNRPLDEQRELLGGDDPTISVRGDFAANAPPGCALSDIQMDRRGHRARTALTLAESSLASPAGMEGWQTVTDEMVERALTEWFGEPIWRRGCSNAVIESAEKTMRAALEAALPAAPRGESE